LGEFTAVSFYSRRIFKVIVDFYYFHKKKHPEDALIRLSAAFVSGGLFNSTFLSQS
jgi:hypothetical protein